MIIINDIYSLIYPDMSWLVNNYDFRQMEDWKTLRENTMREETEQPRYVYPY